MNQVLFQLWGGPADGRTFIEEGPPPLMWRVPVLAGVKFGPFDDLASYDVALYVPRRTVEGSIIYVFDRIESGPVG